MMIIMITKVIIIIEIIKTMKVESMNNNAIDEVRQLNTNLEKSQYELVLTKHVNSLLSDSLISMERQSGANAQYPGRECIEISRIPKPVEDNDLRKTKKFFLKKILDKAGVNVNPNDTEANHRVGNQCDTTSVGGMITDMY